MTNKDDYRETFSQIHGTVRPEELYARRRRSRRVRPLLAIAAAVCLLAALSAGAVAADWFGLRSLLLTKQESGGSQSEAEPSGGRMDSIGLQGYAESPESRALAEWQTFCAGYDTDGALLAQVGNGPTGLEERYALYSPYTREMADRLDEIAGKYGLGLYREINVIDHGELVSRIGGEFLGPKHEKNGAYLYDNGTFQTDGDAFAEGFGQVDYQLRRAVKGTFDEVLLNVGDVTDYREWSYQTACGETVLLALGPSKGLILGDFSDCFVTVNVLSGSDPDNGLWPGGLTGEQLESLADGIDFTVLKTVAQPG